VPEYDRQEREAKSGALSRCRCAYISCRVIGDTGSTDATQELIRRFFAARNISGESYHFPLINFAQARNEALDLAGASTLHSEYLLLLDADVERLVHGGVADAGSTVVQGSYEQTRNIPNDLSDPERAFLERIAVTGAPVSSGIEAALPWSMGPFYLVEAADKERGFRAPVVAAHLRGGKRKRRRFSPVGWI
jgi:glycosyltransferase involved in cell wall biosynthesis